MAVRLDRISDLMLDTPYRVTHDPGSNEEVRVMLQLKILRRNDAGKDHTLTLEYDSGKADGVTIIDELQKGAGKLNLTRHELGLISYAVNECEIIVARAQARESEERGPF